MACLNAITAACAAPPGFLTHGDLGLIAGPVTRLSVARASSAERCTLLSKTITPSVVANWTIVEEGNQIALDDKQFDESDVPLVEAADQRAGQHG